MRSSLLAAGLVSLLALSSACVAKLESEAPVELESEVVKTRAPSDRATMDRYFDSWMGGLEESALRSVLADDVLFEAPGMRLRGANAYLDLVRSGGGLSCPKSGMLERNYAGARGSFLYMCDSVAGPLAFTEHLSVARGKVKNIRGLFDATRFRLAAESAALVARIPAAESARRVDDLDLVLDPAFRAHQGGRTLSRDEFKATASQVIAAFPDFDARYQVIEADATHVAFYETVTGTHTGAPLFGLPPSNRTIGITFSGVYRIEGGKVVEEWFEGDFGSLFAQLQGAMPAPTREQMIANYEDANRAAAECAPDLGDAASPEVFAAWKRAVVPALGGDGSQLANMVTPNFRVTPPGGPSADLEATQTTLETVGRIGEGFDFTDVVPVYVGNRVIVASGPVRYAYQNVNALLGLPALSAPKSVTIHELHTFRTCSGKLARQLTHVDALGLQAQLTTP